MKSKILTVLLVAITHFAMAQTQKNIAQVSDAALVNVFNNATLMAADTSDYLLVKLYKVSNPTGSAEQPSSEVSHDVMVAVSAYDENPKQSLFNVGTFYNPTFVAWKSIKKYERTFVISYTEKGEKKQVTLKATLNGVTVVP